MELRCSNCRGVLEFAANGFQDGYMVKRCEKCAALIKTIAVAMQTRRQRCCGKSEEDCEVCLELDCWATEILECSKKG